MLAEPHVAVFLQFHPSMGRSTPWPTYCRANAKKTIIYVHTDGQFKVVCMSLDCGTKPEHPEETHTDVENMQTQHRKAQVDCQV